MDRYLKGSGQTECWWMLVETDVQIEVVVHDLVVSIALVWHTAWLGKMDSGGIYLQYHTTVCCERIVIDDDRNGRRDLSKDHNLMANIF
jgi:hypothetical protein